MKKFIVLSITILLASAFAVCSSFAVANEWETWYVGARGGLNCRTAPTTDADILTTYSYGTDLQIIGVDNSGEWWETWDGVFQGWCNSEYLVSDPNETPSGGGTYLGRFYITGYRATPEENGGGTTNCFSEELEPLIGQIVAVDPSVIPLKTNIYIPGVGYRETRDTGVRGNVIDVLVSTTAEAYAITGWYDVYLSE